MPTPGDAASAGGDADTQVFGSIPPSLTAMRRRAHKMKRPGPLAGVSFRFNAGGFGIARKTFYVCAEEKGFLGGISSGSVKQMATAARVGGDRLPLRKTVADHNRDRLRALS